MRFNKINITATGEKIVFPVTNSETDLNVEVLRTASSKQLTDFTEQWKVSPSVWSNSWDCQLYEFIVSQYC